MPNIKLTDQFGLDADVKPADTSALLKYFQQLPSLQLNNIDLSKVGGLTLDQPAITSLKTGVSFQNGIPLGQGKPDISIGAGLHGSFALLVRAPGAETLLDVLADNIEIPEGACYVAFGIDASVGASAETGSGLLKFGVAPGATVRIANYREYPLKAGVTLLDALREAVGNFTIPARADDLAGLVDGCLATVTGTGSLRLSVTADLLALSNPLASVSLPAPLPTLAVSAGGSVQVGAAYEVGCEYQICAHKLDARRVRLGWYREQSSEVSVRATLSESVSAGFGSTDLFSTIVGAISSNPAADLNELSQAGLSDSQKAAIQAAVNAAVARKLELALATEISAVRYGDAAFLYEIDLPALTAESRQALEQALRGDLTGLHGGALPGITCAQSVWEKARATSVKLNVNLLGILNFGSIATLTQRGMVLFEPATGALVVTDQATAARIQSTQVNFGADTQKLRQVLAESFLITAAYHGTRRIAGGPSLHCSHSFFDLENSTGRDSMRRKIQAGVALGLFAARDAAPPEGVDDFGRTMIHATTEYDDSLATALFLNASGAPFGHEFYEDMGRRAVLFLVGEDDADSARRGPATDGDLWARMKVQGQANFAALFPNLPAPLLRAVIADYSTIMWWADAMAGAAQRLAAIRQWFGRNPTASADDPAFVRLRQDLASHLKDVAATTREEFGEPWGLVAMNEAASRRAGATILITGPKLVRMKERAMTVIGGVSTG